MREIRLSNSNKKVIVDDEDYDWLNVFLWRITSTGYAISRGGEGELMHRVMMNNPTKEIDHANGDRLDNRRENLRVATHSENMSNRKKHTLGRLGVSFHKDSGKYRAQIRHGGKVHHLGLYNVEEEASQAYISAAKKYHGAFMANN
jgi:hypothetical protein